GNRANVLILDSCRDNPFNKSMTKGEAPRGLKVMESKTYSTLIVYATKPGDVAQDCARDSKYSLYTTHLLKFIDKPNLDVIDMFRNVTREVAKASDNKQQPWMSYSNFPPICLAGCGGPTPPPPSEENFFGSNTIGEHLLPELLEDYILSQGGGRFT